MSNVSIADIVNRYPLDNGQKVHLTAALMEREQAMADTLHQAGMQFGLFPQIVAEVLAQVEMGEPISTEQRDMIHQQFHRLMEQIAAAQRGDGPMPTPPQ
jgi:hypothetical protein